jgi:AraC family multidrug resistance transcriptional activator
MIDKDAIITTLLSWIDENLDKSLKIEDVANKSGYSRWHLQRMFFAVTNKKLASYIREKKLTAAAKDLLETQMSIIDIAVKYGYPTQQAFTRNFKQRYPYPPAAYRRIMTQTEEATETTVVATNRHVQLSHANTCCSL